MTGTWYPPSLGTGGVLIEAQLFTNPPFAQMTEHDPTGRSGHEPTPPAELIITREPEFPGQVVWQQGATLGIAPDEATASDDAAAICQEVE